MSGFSMLVACDLFQAEDTYSELFAALNNLGATAALDSSWTLEFDGRCDELRDELAKFLGPKDRLLVAITRDLTGWRLIAEKP